MKTMTKTEVAQGWWARGRVLLVAAAVLALTGCGGGEGGGGEPGGGGGDGTSAAGPGEGSAAGFGGLMMESEPEGALSVVAMREAVVPGSEVTVVGRIAGAMEPFSADYATFVLADESLETCERIPGDTCETPWDACCAAPETIKASRVSVQVPGDGGFPREGTLKGVAGLTELDTVVVTGTFAEGSTEENPIINVAGIYRKTE